MVHPEKIFGRLGNRMFQGAYLYSQARNGAIPDIYVQDFELWEPYQEDIRRMYGASEVTDRRVAIHVRRGDYLATNGFYADLGASDYYERAIAAFPDSRFLVFCHDGQDEKQDSEDMQWCLGRFQGDRFDFHEAKGEIDDLNVMASCSGIIMANSTFSWWAAFLSSAKVIAPSQWFANSGGISYPSSWTVL